MVGDDHPAHRFAFQRAGQQALPQRHRAFGVKTGINQRPAIAVVQRKDIDMIKRHRQRQAQPEDTLGHLYGFSFGGWGLERKAQTVAHANNALGVTA